MFQTALWLESLLIFALILLNGVFAMSEIAVVSARKPRLRQRAEDGDAGARRALHLAENQTRFLSTVQIGITLIGVFAGAYGGASIAAHIDVWLEQFPALAEYSEEIALASVVAAITFLSLVIGELVPKRIALDNPERIASLLSRPMHVVSIMASPIVRLLSATTDGLFRLLHLPVATEPPVTEADVSAMLEVGAAAGVFEERETELVERIFRLGDQRVDSLMTPRNRIVWLDINDPVEQHTATITRNRRSRYVVGDGSVDHVIGIVRSKDLTARLLEERPLDIAGALRQPLFIPPSVRALRLLEMFRESGIHMALVIDEFGGIDGLVTLNDLLEQIAGNLQPDVDPQIVRRVDGSWLVDASLSLEEFRDELDLRAPPEHRLEGYSTLGGLTIAVLGRIPRTGDTFSALGVDFEIVDMDGNRVDKLLVRRASGS